MKKITRKDPDESPHHSVSDQDLHCLHMSHKKNDML